MNREEILAMKPGRKIDRLIGEKIIGCRVRKESNRETFELVIPGGVSQISFVHEDGPWSAVPHYSTSIADAWPIVELLKSMGRVFIIKADGLMRGDFEPGYWVQAGDGDFVRASTAPEGICKAALLAFKV